MNAPLPIPCAECGFIICRKGDHLPERYIISKCPARIRGCASEHVTEWRNVDADVFVHRNDALGTCLASGTAWSWDWTLVTCPECLASRQSEAKSIAYPIDIVRVRTAACGLGDLLAGNKSVRSVGFDWVKGCLMVYHRGDAKENVFRYDGFDVVWSKHKPL